MNVPARFSNKLIYQREVERMQGIHRKKLKEMRSTNRTNSVSLMDNRAPQRFRHLELNLKKRQLEEERYFRIERENKLLMQKMFSIMKQKPEPQSMEYVPGLRLSSSQQPRVDNYLSPCSMLPGQARLIPSMNREKRRRAYTRIMSENARILERISTRKAVYSRDTWDKDRKRTEHYLGNIGKDLTTGYLPQGPDGRSVYFDPRALSPSARLPRLRKTQTRRGRSRRSKRGASRQRARTAPASTDAFANGGGLNSSGSLSDGCILAETVRDDGATVLRVTEIPTVAGPDGSAELATSGVRVMASSADGGGASLQLSIDNVKEIAAKSRDSASLMAALETLRLLDARQNFSRMSTQFSGAVLHALGLAVSRRVQVVREASGGISLAVTAEAQDHGEGGAPLPSPVRMSSGGGGGGGGDSGFGSGGGDGDGAAGAGAGAGAGPADSSGPANFDDTPPVVAQSNDSGPATEAPGAAGGSGGTA